MIYAVYGRWDHGSPLRSYDVDRIGMNFRPGDEGVCVWVEPAEPSMLLISVDVEAASYEDALRHGRVALAEAAGIGSLTGSPVEVVAMTEEGQATWSL